MSLFDITKKAFQDEFEKIAGELQGHHRSGKRPLSATTLLRNEKGIKKVSDIIKLSSPPHIFAAGAVTGAAGLHMIRKANEDRRLGKQVRLQQQ